MDNSNPPQGVSWRDYVDRRLEDFDRGLTRWLDERFRAQQEAIKVLVDANQRAFDQQGRRLALFGVGLVCVQILLNVAFKLLWI